MTVKTIKELKTLFNNTTSAHTKLGIARTIIIEQEALLSKWQAAGEQRAQDLVTNPESKLGHIKGISKCTCGWSNKDVPESAHSSWCDKVK